MIVDVYLFEGAPVHAYMYVWDEFVCVYVCVYVYVYVWVYVYVKSGLYCVKL